MFLKRDAGRLYRINLNSHSGLYYQPDLTGFNKVFFLDFPLVFIEKTTHTHHHHETRTRFPAK